MIKNDTARRHLRDIAVALGLLTRLPIRLPNSAYARGAAAAWAYPLVGVVTGGIAWILGAVLLWLGFGAVATALVILATLVVITGAMHEDGLADCADGFWGGWDVARRLEIMKDSQIGTYGVIALVLSLAARLAGIWALIEADWLWALIGIGALSRAGMPVLMAALPHARDTGLSHAQGRPDRRTAFVAIGIGVGAALLTLGGAGVAATLTAALILLAVRQIALAKIGGQTGDVLGASQQMVEVAVLVILVG